MSDILFSSIPDSKWAKSKYTQHPVTNTSFNHGELIPLRCIEAVPGDEYNIELSSILRMSTPIAPIMSGIDYEVDAFFVPMRLVWKYADKFFGAKTGNSVANDNYSPIIANDQYVIPHYSLYRYGVNKNSLNAYLGRPVVASDSSKYNYGLVSALPERCYYLIWDYFYRAQAVQAPYQIKIDGNGLYDADHQYYAVGRKGTSYLQDSPILKVNKVFDYFTASLLEPLANRVVLPLGDVAPVKAYTGAAPSSPSANVNAGGVSIPAYSSMALTMGAGVDVKVDLKEATASTLEDLRYAVSLEHYLERMQYAGDTFNGILMAQYGVTNGDRSLSMPQRLGSIKFHVNVAQVTAMADTTQEGAIKPAGTSAAVSVTGNKGHLANFAVSEPGYIMILGFARQSKQIYSQGLSKRDTKFTVHEFFNPCFANIGDVAVKNKEIYLAGGNADDQVFGYQSAWSEYRYENDLSTGVLNPTVANSLDFWTLTNNFLSLPQLNGTFLEESRDNITRALVTGSTGPDYIASFQFNITKTTLVPVTSVPGIRGNLGL